MSFFIFKDNRQFWKRQTTKDFLNIKHTRIHDVAETLKRVISFAWLHNDWFMHVEKQRKYYIKSPFNLITVVERKCFPFKERRLFCIYIIQRFERKTGTNEDGI